MANFSSWVYTCLVILGKYVYPHPYMMANFSSWVYTCLVILGKYDARKRTLIKYVSWQLRISWDQVEEVEAMLAESLEAREYQLSE